MKSMEGIAIVIIAVILTSAFWYAQINAPKHIPINTLPTTAVMCSLASQPANTTNSSPNLFDAQIGFVYVGLVNSTEYDYYHGFKMYPANYYPLTGVINLTYLGKPQDAQGDAIFESYLVTVSTDTGMTANYLSWCGTNIKESYSNLTFPPPVSSRYLFFDYNLTLNKSYQLPFGDGGLTQSWNGSLGLLQNGTPNAINVTLQRGDWVILSGNSSWAVANKAKNDILEQIRLEKTEHGDWSYTQKITVPLSYAVPEFPQLIFLPLFLFVFSIVIIIRTRKNCVRRKHRVSKHERERLILVPTRPSLPGRRPFHCHTHG